MPFILLLALTTCWLPQASADGETKVCGPELSVIEPAFDPDLRIHTDRRRVEYRGETFDLRPKEYALLKAIILAPNEVLLYGDLIDKIWASKKPEDPGASVRQEIAGLRKTFLKNFPDFNKIKISWSEGVYWARENYQRTVVGQIGVACFIGEGYAKGEAITLTSQEHAVLTAAMAAPLEFRCISASDARIDSSATFRTVTSSLNRKFRPLLGLTVLVSGPRHSISFQLNEALRDPE